MMIITSQQLTAFLLGCLLVFSCNANRFESSNTNTPQPENHSETASIQKPIQPATAMRNTNQPAQAPAEPVSQPVSDNNALPTAVSDNQNQRQAKQTALQFPWLTTPANEADALQNRIAPPAGYERIPMPAGSFAGYLRSLPLKPGKPPVLLFDGSPKYNQSAHAAVFNIDPGTEDLQQCADAVMRLRAEYLWATGQYNSIHFNFTSGHPAQYSQWRQGYRPVISGNKVSWQKQASAQNSVSYASFRQYLKQVFTYAGTYSLSKELQPVPNLQNIAPGDVFIKGGMPGHVVLVMDVAQNAEGKKVFLLAQSYMPAQEIHLLINPDNPDLSPWYSAQFTGDLVTPEWTFAPNSLKRFE